MRALRGGELVCLYVTDAASESKKREGTRPGSQWMLFRRKLNRVLSLPLLRNLIVILILLDLFSIALVCHVGIAAELKRSHPTPSECHSRNCCDSLVTLIQASNPTVQTTIRDNLFVLQYITTMAILLECLLEVRCGTGCCLHGWHWYFQMPTRSLLFTDGKNQLPFCFICCRGLRVWVCSCDGCIPPSVSVGCQLC